MPRSVDIPVTHSKAYTDANPEIRRTLSKSAKIEVLETLPKYLIVI